MKQWQIWVSLRLVMAGIFLWAFVDKVFGLGFATTPDKAWLNGSSPTLGFLKFGTYGPLAPIYQAIAGHPVVDVLFMIGLLGVGMALLLGIGLRFAGYAGTMMMLLMWSAMLPPKNNPLLDEHIVYSLVLLGLPFTETAGRWSLKKQWERTTIAKQWPLLR